ncbi:MAG: ABC transporter permease [Candidatus Delongbacteria bacterium]|nr:ABC transporter permease [Candidatus Delongbacteria bacterium]MBN2835523.1 ABC transporter permease [Candidatus Delongbacteria bacterium]
MRTILIILRKEFRQIFRNRSMLPIIFVMPIIQLLILANAATFELKSVSFCIVDRDRSSLSQELISRFSGNTYFNFEGLFTTVDEAEIMLTEDKADLIINIPDNFEKDLLTTSGNLQLIVNAIDGSAAGIINSYAQAILKDFNREIRTELVNFYNPVNTPKITIENSYWYNPELNYKTFMVPGILVLLVTMIGAFLASMNIVREKEIGTIEQINVTPIKKYQFIVGKLAPFFIISLFELWFGLVISKLIYAIPTVGNMGLIFGFAAIYMIMVLGLGLLISTITDSQQQAMFLTWFIMVIFILMSGLFTPIASMPDWAQKITLFNPVAYFIEVMRMVMLKGSGFNDIKVHFGIMSIMAVSTVTMAVFRYKKTV